jgi:hypothetical protein
MEMFDFQLKVPNVHLLPESTDQAEAPSIVGCVSMAIPTSDLPGLSGSLPRITVSLVRRVKIEEFNSTTTRHRETKPRKIRLWKESPPRGQTTPVMRQTWRAHRQAIARNDICHAPDEIDCHGGEGRTWLRFIFHIPIPTNLPPTIDSVGGSISYTVEATVSTPAPGAEQPQLQASQPIDMVHCAILRTITHLRRYPGDSVTTQLDITPMSTEKGITYALHWLARSTVSRGERASDLKYIIAKELHWSIEETVKCVGINRQTRTCLHQYTRRLSEGRLKGRWVAPGGSQDGKDSIKIPFEVSVPRGIGVSDTTTSLASYQRHHSTPDLESEEEQLAVTVDHRLNLEVVTGDDTFHQGTGDLLDRRYPVKSFKATFPLLVRQNVCEKSPSPGQTSEIPPLYEEPYTAPPAYEGS